MAKFLHKNKMSHEMHVGSTIRGIEFSSERSLKLLKVWFKEAMEDEKNECLESFAEGREAPRAVRISNQSKFKFNYFFTYFFS
jgi:hypothetical protein